MLSENPFATEGNWYRGNLHTHTTSSDGVKTPAAMAEHYHQNGYDFLCLTDHNKVTDIAGLSSDDFLVIPGTELDVQRKEQGYHVVAVNVPTVPTSLPGTEVSAALAAIREMGGEAIVAHPYDLTINDLLPVEGYLGIEIFNTSVHHAFGRGYATLHWDALLSRGKRVWGFATDDAHWHFNDHRPNDACGGWIMVKAPSLTLPNILDSIRRGLFYASNGPEIKDITITDETVTVRTSDCKSITFVGQNWGTSEKFTALGSRLLSSAEYKRRGTEEYLRVECVTKEGQCAWSNPIWFTQRGDKDVL